MSTITMQRPMWDVDTIKSRDVVVKAASGTIEAMPGHLLYKQADGTYKAYAVGTTISDEGAVGVLGEAATLTTSATTCRVIEYGDVYIEAVRQAGIEASKVSDEALRGYSTNRTAINFIDYKKEVIAHGYSV